MAYHQAQLSQYSLFRDTNSVFDRRQRIPGSPIWLRQHGQLSFFRLYPAGVRSPDPVQFPHPSEQQRRKAQHRRDGTIPSPSTPCSPASGGCMTIPLWGIVGPVNGQRIYANVTAVPPVFQDRFSFVVADADVRKYWEFFKKYTLALAAFRRRLGSPRGIRESAPILGGRRGFHLQCPCEFRESTQKAGRVLFFPIRFSAARVRLLRIQRHQKVRVEHRVPISFHPGILAWSGPFPSL